MDDPRPRQVLIAGAGIAGLVAALAFAEKGFSVHLCEQAPELQEAGAGLQLSPNATRILRRHGVLDMVARAATQPAAVSIRDARHLHELARVPLGLAEERWRAPYLVVHRADLQSALVQRVRQEADIRLLTGARVQDAAFHPRGVTVSMDHGGKIVETQCMLLVGADGVWSTVRGMGSAAASRPTGDVAWRAMIRRESEEGAALSAMMPGNEVLTFVHPRFHLVAYPLRGGDAINLVVVARGREDAEGWDGRAEAAELARIIGGRKSVLAGLVAATAPWRKWPIHEIDARTAWTGSNGVALIGDAAHAMPPFAAQGAAMAIEDAACLATLVAGRRGDLAGALAMYEKLRRPRVTKVAARGRFNRFAWHARWPVSVVRDRVLRAKGPAGLAADMDWLYGYDAIGAAEAALATLNAGSG